MFLAALGSSYWRVSSLLESHHSGRLHASRHIWLATPATICTARPARSCWTGLEFVLTRLPQKRFCTLIMQVATPAHGRPSCPHCARVCDKIECSHIVQKKIALCLQAVHCQHSKSRRHNMITWSLKHPLAGKHTTECSLVTSSFSMQSVCLQLQSFLLHSM